MTLKQLRYFLAVLQAGSFTGAARSLHVAQPAIGVQIGHLEDELGVALLVRHSRGVVPTEAGERLAREAAGVVAEAERMRRDFMEMGREPRGRIALGLTGTAVRALGARLVQACRRKYPDLDLTVMGGMCHRLSDRLGQGQLDLAVACDPPANSGALSEALATEPLYFVAPPGHALAEGPDIPLRVALEADLVLPPRPSVIRRRMVDAAGLNGAELRPAFEAEPVAMMKDLVRHGLACAVMPYGAVRPDVEAGSLIAMRIVEPRLTRTLNLSCSEAGQGGKAVEAVRGEIRALVADLVTSHAVDWAPCAASVGPLPPSRGSSR